MQRQSQPLDALARFIGTGAYAGYAPLVPGTVGTLPGLLLAIPLATLCERTVGGYLAVLVVAVAAAVWSAGRCCELFDAGDPRQVVIDEVVGFFVTMAFLPADLRTLGLAFVAFRFFDILKPPPVRQAERLPGGVGVVADDLLAGLYANLTVRLIDWLSAAA